MSWRFVLAMARREIRASRRRLLLYGSCVAVGIAALVGLHGLRSTVEEALDREGRRMLGADLRLASRTPLQGELAAAVEDLAAAEGVSVARVTRFGSMVLSVESGRSRLVDVQGVDGAHPLYGAIRTEPAGALSALRRGEAVALVDPSLLVQLGAGIGETLVIGENDFRIVGTVVRAPGALALQTRIAPRVFISRSRVEATGLVQRGSLVDHLVYVAEARPVLATWLDARRLELEAAHVRVRTVAEHQDELGRSFGTLTRYLGLVGLAALALGAVGVAAGVRVLVRDRLDTAALLRALGARSHEIFAIYGLLALALGLVAGGVGSAIGIVLQWGMPGLLAEWLPVAPRVRPDVGAMLTGVGLGVGVAVLFAIGPLLDLRRVPPLRALRREFDGEALPATARVALAAVLLAGLVAASLWQAPRPAVGLSFAAALAAALAVLGAVAAVTMAWLRAHPLRRAPFYVRQGIANLFRPRNHTASTLLAVGFGLFLLSTLTAVQHTILHQLRVDTRSDRPNLVVFDVQPDQLEGVEGVLDDWEASILDRASLVSARIAGVRGRPNAEWLKGSQTDRELRWALQREYRLTHSEVLRESEVVVEGRWWSDEDALARAPAPVSLETGIARSLGVVPGDTVSWEIQGVRVDSVIRSLREVDWGRFATNFFAVFPPGVIDRAPSTTVLLARVEGDEARAELQRRLVDGFPNLSILDASVLLEAFDRVAGQIWIAVRALALFALATGLMVLVAAASTARHERTREVLLLRTLGASSATLRRIVAVEALTLGGLAAFVGTGLALAAGWALSRFVFELDFHPPWLELAGLAGGTVVLSTLLGHSGVGFVSPPSPLEALREGESRGVGSG